MENEHKLKAFDDICDFFNRENTMDEQGFNDICDYYAREKFAEQEIRLKKYRITIDVETEEELSNNINEICRAIMDEDFRGAVTKINVEEIGETKKGTKKGVVCASFNAG